jgi:hypothetical protein
MRRLALGLVLALLAFGSSGSPAHERRLARTLTVIGNAGLDEQ